MPLLTDRLDLRHRREPDLIKLAEVIGVIQRVAPAEDLLLIGAQVRDVLLKWGLELDIRGFTRDIDLAVAVRDWPHFLALRQRLLDSGRFFESSEPHRLRFDHPTGKLVDIIPFDGVERPDRSIVWPPGHAVQMSAIGFRESVAHGIAVELPGDVAIRVVSIASFAALKIFAWTERGRAEREKDARDLLLVLRHYDKVVGTEQLYRLPDPVLDETGGDNNLMAAWLLGQHIAEVLAPDGAGASGASSGKGPPHDRLVALLRREADPEGPTHLAAEMDPARLAQVLTLLDWLRRGLEGPWQPTS